MQRCDPEGGKRKKCRREGKKKARKEEKYLQI